jgi:uncharacterized membrane protein
MANCGGYYEYMSRKEFSPHTGHRPHWHREHTGEHRFPVAIVVIAVIALQSLLPNELSLSFQTEISILEGALLLVLLIFGPRRIHNHHMPMRYLSLGLTGVMTLSNTASALKLIEFLVTGNATNGTTLLLSGASIWLTNIVIFALWFWEFDRGGPGARAQALHRYPDFLFPQMEDEHMADIHWHPNFFDYLYISFTNASAFSPTDVLPLTRWAKMLMLLQSVTSLLTVGLVVARAVNILH